MRGIQLNGSAEDPQIGVTIQGKSTGAYLCFNKRGRLTTRVSVYPSSCTPAFDFMFPLSLPPLLFRDAFPRLWNQHRLKQEEREKRENMKSKARV